MKHNYHFVLSKELKNKIINFANDQDMTLSETVIYIFNHMKPVIEKHYLIDLVCNKGAYACFGAESDMHVYFDKTDYKYLKQIQSNLYCFSMAIILRWALSEFFLRIKKHGFESFLVGVYRFGKFFLGACVVSKEQSGTNKNQKKYLFSCINNIKNICHIYDHEYNLIETKFT